MVWQFSIPFLICSGPIFKAWAAPAAHRMFSKLNFPVSFDVKLNEPLGRQMVPDNP